MCACEFGVSVPTHTGFRSEGVCAASLPTTMAVVAGLLVQNALKSVDMVSLVARSLYLSLSIYLSLSLFLSFSFSLVDTRPTQRPP